VTQDLSELVPIRFEPGEVPDADASAQQEAAVVAQLFATAHQTIADVQFGGTP
jgi:hypothetical protein